MIGSTIVLNGSVTTDATLAMLVVTVGLAVLSVLCFWRHVKTNPRLDGWDGMLLLAGILLAVWSIILGIFLIYKVTA